MKTAFNYFEKGHGTHEKKNCFKEQKLKPMYQKNKKKKKKKIG